MCFLLHIHCLIFIFATQGSKFFENEKKKEEQVQHRIQEQEKCRQKITEAELKRGLDEVRKVTFSIFLVFTCISFTVSFSIKLEVQRGPHISPNLRFAKIQITDKLLSVVVNVRYLCIYRFMPVADLKLCRP